ncbi:hypothetical protein PMAC_001659 [Pneumocystis sp. 'macacae']|nr:hypothetical protein PMAC_001659 [Pneumocystis sp. 'macacae']
MTKQNTRRVLKSSARTVARAVKRRAQAGAQNVYEDEEILLALIVKNDYKDDKCKESLEKYCKELKSAALKEKEIHEKLEDLCEDKKRETKCTELKDKITKKCTEFKDKLKTEAEKDISNLKDEDCKKNEQQCLFLEGACPTDLKDNCNKLRNKCYQKKRDEVAEKVLLRALSGKLKEEDSCKQKLKEVCLELSGESDELTEFCFDKEKTCQSLITKEQSLCNSLKGEVDNLLKKQNELQMKCLPLLKKCYFYSTDCTGNEPECEKLKNSCKGKGVVYERPGSDFEPTRPGLTVAEEIELQELYGEAAREGVYIGRPPTRDAAELLLLLSQRSTKSGAKEKCQDVLDTKCKDLKEHGLLKDFCDGNTNKASNNGTEECNKLDKKEKESALALTTKIGNKYFAETKPNTIIGWNYLPKFFTDKDCRTLESDCLYFGGQGGTDTPCSNLRAACYKKGLDAVANEVLQRELRGSLQGSNGTWLENLQKGIAKACKELKGLSDELFVLCMDPKSTALTLSTDLRMRAVYLQELLNEKRDFPTRKDCEVLEKKCEDLGPDSREIGWPCYTLNQHCRRLENAEQLEEELLKEKIEGLDKFDSCVESLRKRCNGWSRRGNRFALACLAQNVTCRIITKSVKSKCAALDGHMKDNQIVKNAKEDDKKESLCSSWWPYCNKYMSSCEDLRADKDHTCKKLKEQCKSFIEQEELKVKLLDELKGNLKKKEECKAKLDGYCTEWANATNSLKTLCTDKSTTNKSDTDFRNELCEKLVQRVKKQCPELLKGLTEAKNKLEKGGEEYKGIKKEAEDAMEKAGLVLVTTKAAGDGSGNKVEVVAKNEKKFKLVKRDAKKHVVLKVTEEEVKAFDLVSLAFNLYVELKEICKDSVKKCGFEKECEECKEACKTVRNVCTGLKPLEIKEYEAKIETRNITTTVTSTVESGEKTVGQECKSIQTTDVWVTKTSTHTSTSTSTSTTTSTVTLTSTRRCKPTKCTTGDEAGDVTPSGGLRITGWSVMKGVLLGMGQMNMVGKSMFVFWVVGLNLARGAARAVKRRDAGGKGVNVYEDEYYLLALILKKDNLVEAQCKQELKSYCDNLKKIDENFSIHSKLKDVCENNGEKKCKDLKTNVETKCNTFKTELEKVYQKPSDDNCKENERQCLFLEAACPDDLKENCNKLRTNCYQKKREEVAEEALLRALNGNLEDAGKCKEKIKEICKVLGQESDELLKKCVDIDKTCKPLAEAAKNKCELLKKEVEKALKPDEELQRNGHSLLKECHFYGENCKNEKPNCDKLKDKCKTAGIVYVPPGSEFDPTRPEPTLAEKIGLDELYKEAAAQGVVIERALEGDPLDLLVLLSGKESFSEAKCKTILSTKCDSFKHLAKDLEELCNNTEKHANKCQEYYQKFQEKNQVLTRRFQNRNFKNEVMLWNKLPEFLTDHDCVEFQFECFYYEGQSFGTQCKNVRAACYKRGLDEFANKALQDVLRGKFNDETGELSKEFPKELVKVCKDLKNKTKELFALCVQPGETIFVLQTDLRIKTNQLQDHLNENRDLPTRQHCTDLLKKCEVLGQDSKEIHWPCWTLKHNCKRLGVAEQLEEKLLAEKVEKLDDFESCVETLRGRCSGWGRRGRTRYALGCVAPNATCTYLTGSVESKCATLRTRIEKEGIVEKAKKEKEEKKTQETCERWMPFCSKFMYSCKNLTADGDHTCKKLEEQCESFIKQQELKTELLYELKGYLKTAGECKTKLDIYCTEWEKATNKLKNLCTDGTGKDDFRNKLCGELVERVKKQCPVLERKLIEASEELKEKEKEYTKIKEKAVKAMETAKLVLVTTRATGNKSENKAPAPAAKSEKQFKLVRRDAKTSVVAKVTEEEITAFDLVSQALSLYVELKEECQDLLKGCGFRKECEGCKDACEKIDGICSKVKPLEVTEHKNDRHVGHTHIDTHKHIDVHVDDDIDGDADVDPAVQADEVHDRGRGRRGDAEWGAEDAWVGREGGVVGDDDFSYDLGWVGIFGKASSPAPRSVHASLRTQCIPASQYAVCALDACGRVLDASGTRVFARN